MPRVAIHTAKASLPPSIEVVLSSELWELVLGQIQHQGEKSNNAGGLLHAAASPSASVPGNALATTNGWHEQQQYQRLPVAISRVYTLPRRRSKGQNVIESLVCWACLDTDKTGLKAASSSSTSTSTIQGTLRTTSTLRKKYPDLLGLITCTMSIRPVKPIEISQVFLLAKDKTSYNYANDHDLELQDYLARDGRIIRQDENLEIPVIPDTATHASVGFEAEETRPNGDLLVAHLQQKSVAYQVTMIEPVLQGYITESTEIIVLPPLALDSITSTNPKHASSLTTATKQLSSNQTNGEIKDDHWHVDEDFLAGSMDASFDSETPLHALPDYMLNGSHNGNVNGTVSASTSTWQSPLSSPGSRNAQLDSVISPGGKASSIASSEHGGVGGRSASSKGRLIRVAACPIHIDEEDLTPSISISGGNGKEVAQKEEDEHLRAYVRIKDLSRLGLFNGDKVEIYPLNATVDKRRIVRVFGLRKMPRMPDSDLWLLLSPILLHNLSNPSIVRLQSLPSTHHPHSHTTTARFSTDPSIDYPLARSITISRVASEYSMQKKYQPLFISALKDYFKNCQRIAKEGDLIAVPIDASMVMFLSKDAGAENGAGGNEVPDDIQDFELPSGNSGPTAIAYFKVAKLEQQTPTSSTGNINTGISSGVYGCHIDPATTTMIQTGLTNSPVPDAYSFLGIAGASAPSSTLSQLPNLGSETVMGHLMDFVKASSMRHTVDLNMNLTVMLKGAKGSGKATLARHVAQMSGFHLLELDCYELLGDTDTKTEGNLAARFDRAASCTPCILLLRHIEALARKSQVLETGQEPTIASTLQDCLKVAQEARKTTGYPLVIVGTTSDADKIPLSVLGLFKEEFSIEAPAEAERLVLLESMLETDILSPDVSVKNLAVQTAALVAGDLADLCERARKHAVARLLEKKLDINDCRYAGVSLTAADFTSALDHARSSYSESIGAPKIPNVTWDDVGGLAKVKTEILDTIQLPLQHPELFEEGLKKRSGVLLYGPPGTGKTLLAKAVATSCSLNFFSVKGPELLNMYIGESEANVRRVFQRARDAKPCVIFFDELDSVAPKRGNQGDSGGVMDRIVSQLLAELDGMAEGKGGADVFVIGATNRPDLLDPALLRPGRFDRMLYLGVSDNHDAQLKIIEALTRKFKLEPECNLEEIARQCPFNYTGADFYALCSDSLLKAMSRKAEAVDARIAELNATPEYARNPMTPQYYLAELARPEEMQVTVAQQDFELALGELVPSVSEAEMLHYKVVQQRFNPDTAKQEAKQESVAIDRKGKGKARQL